MSSVFQKVAAVRGMNDILPQSSPYWEKFEEIVRTWLHSYGYGNIRVPILESTRLFTRGIGEVTDIVEKEMYTFTDALNGESLTLRPEITAGIVRSAIEHHLLYERPKRVYSLGPVFRHERPQRGRYRQFHQIDIEALGFAGPDIDAEIIMMLARLWKLLNLTDMRLELNSLGQAAERAAHRAGLINYLEAHRAELDEDSLRRLHTNPLRILDTKNPHLQDLVNQAPRLFDFLGKKSRLHFDAVCHYLDEAQIKWKFNPRLVRGLDYYNLTVFEWITDHLGAQGTVCGGGRYDGLIELLGGKPTPAVGCAIGIERVLDLWATPDIKHLVSNACEIYVIHQGDAAQQLAVKVGELLRDADFSVIVHAGRSSFASQFKQADVSGAHVAVILGEQEVAMSEASIKFLRVDAVNSTGQQRVPLVRLVETLKHKDSHGL